MTVTGGSTDDEPTRVDREPPSFPRVDDSQSSSSSSTGASSAPLFSSPGAGQADPAEAQTSSIVTRPLDADKSPNGSGRGGRLRWIVAGLATLLVVVLVGGIILVAVPHAGTPGLAAHYAPASSTGYVEIRLDLPGDQKNNFAAFMSHFPGFADQASFQQKIDETLNSILLKSETGLDWNKDVKPWFGGQIGMFGDFRAPPMSTTGLSVGSSDMKPTPTNVVVAFSVTDKAKLQSVIDANAGESQVASTDYQGQQIKTLAQPGGTSTAPSYVVTDDALLAAPTIDLIKSALDVKAGQTKALADDSYFVQQLGALHADRLATFYYDASKLLAATTPTTNSAVPAQCTQFSQAQTNVKYVGEMRAEGDHLAVNMRSQLPTGDNAPPAPTNKQTNLAQSMPSDTVAYLETRNLGSSLGWAIKSLLACMNSMEPSTGPGASGNGAGTGIGDPSKIFEQLAGAKPEDYLDFVNDAALGLTYANDKLGLGIVANIDDEATAKARMDKVVGLLQLAGGTLLPSGGGSGSAITTEQIDHNGTTVNVIHVTSSTAGSSPINVQVAVANNRLYLGMDDFVTAALDRSASDSLASNGRYQKAISDAPADNAGVVYLDLATLAEIYEEKLPAEEVQDFNTNTKPFIDPLSTLSLVGHVDGGTLISNMFLFVE